MQKLQKLKAILLEINQLFRSFGLMHAIFFMVEHVFRRKNKHKKIKALVEVKINFFMSRARSDELSLANTISLPQDIKNLSYSELLPIDAYHPTSCSMKNFKLSEDIYLYCLHYGDLIKAAYFRKILEKNFSLIQNNNLNSTMSKFHSFLDKQEFLYQLRSPASDLRLNQENEQQFLHFLKGKNVAVVGPANSDEITGDEIDGFDIVIRLNFRSDIKLPKKNHGSKTDISYYSIAHFQRYPVLIAEAIDNLEWCCMKLERDASSLRSTKVVEIKNNKIRAFFTRDQQLLNGSLNMVPNASMDALTFNPARLKIFCTDLFIGSHIKSYVSDPIHKQFLSDHSITDSCRTHDCFSNFLFLQRLYDLQIVEVDEKLKKILELDIEEYASILQRKYGHLTLADTNPLS